MRPGRGGAAPRHHAVMAARKSGDLQLDVELIRSAVSISVALRPKLIAEAAVSSSI